MNASTQTHPAESSEFLSRLHDGELSVSEAASFEEHRRTCSRCRKSADSYSRALSIFRSASPRPAASDLSARILRKVRAQSPSRRPFGVTFGIDVRWAGVCAAALVVVIMAASILDEGPMPSIVLAPPPAEPRSVRARLLESPAPEAAAKENPAAKPDRRASLQAAAPSNAAPSPKVGALSSEVAQSAEAPAAPRTPGVTDATAPIGADFSAREEAAQPPAAAAIGGTAATSDAPLEKRRDEPRIAAKMAAPPAARNRVSADAPGGEAGAAAPPASEAEAPVRMRIQPMDGFGSAPAIERGEDFALAPFRGREFLLVVDTGGRVRSCVPAGARESDAKESLRQRTKDEREREDLSPLLDVRFAPGDRPRRLRIRIE